MEKKIKEAKINVFRRLLEKNLLARGITYDPNQSVYHFNVDKCECTLTIQGTTIIIENHTTKKVDHYNFGSGLRNSVYVHSRLTTGSNDEVDITHTDVYMEDDHLLSVSAAAVMDTDVTHERCANKVLFFSDQLVGDTIYDTIDNLEKFDGTTAKAVSQDIARLTIPEFVLCSSLKNERKLLQDLKIDRVRR